MAGPRDGDRGQVVGEFSFVCDPACAGQARRWLEASLQSALGANRDGAALIADAVIIASELVTNAIQAACGRGTLRWQVWPGELALVVVDDAPGWPTLLHPGPTDTHGRGLHIVRSLAADMGACTVQGGKQVWATLTLPSSMARRR